MLAPDGNSALRGQQHDARPGPALTEVSVPVLVGDTLIGQFAAPEAHGDLAVAARLVLHNAAAAAGRLLDLARQAREVQARSRSELLAELLMSDSAINEDLVDRARQLNIVLAGWHVAVRIEADDLDGSSRDEVRRFELLESAGQIALQAAAAAGSTWHLSRVARAIVLIRVTASDPGPQAVAQAARAAARGAAGAQRPGARGGVPRRCGRAARRSDGAARLGGGSPGRAVRRPGRPQDARRGHARRGGCAADADGVVRVRHGPRLGAGPARAAGKPGPGPGPTRPSGPWPPTWTSRGPSSRPPSSCTCTATRWPTGSAPSPTCWTLTWRIPTSALRCS